MNNAVLYTNQAIFIMIVSVDLTFTGLVGNQFAPDKSLATLPFALITLTTAVTAAAVPLVVKQIRQRASFIGGCSFAFLSGLLAFYAIQTKSFLVFCLAAVLVGAYQAFGQYYRLAAADGTPEPDRKGTVVSRIVLFGVIGALAGPLALRVIVNTQSYNGISHAYLLTSLLAGVSFVLFALAYRDKPSWSGALNRDHTKRPFRPHPYATAIASNAAGYAVMMLTMTAVPIAMVDQGFDVRDSAVVMQAHLIAMFATSIVSGKLINNVGEYVVIGTGITFAGLSCLIMLLSSSFHSFLIAMALVGIGWNFMFVAGTSLVSKSYPHESRFRYQSIAECTVFGFAAAGALGAGLVLNTWSWYYVNLMALPLLAVPAALIASTSYTNNRRAKTDP